MSNYLSEKGQKGEYHGKCKRDTEQNAEYQRYDENHQCHVHDIFIKNAESKEKSGRYRAVFLWSAKCSGTFYAVRSGYQEYFLGKEGVAEDQKKRGYIVITADKGLAGAYNHNVLKLASEEIEKHPQSELFVVGELAVSIL